ncbi:DUF2807 domain-containing protein [uncultured Arcticibacterium sp.]|uniref:GIN domain-containing protein n=1 Tax=uncultured Arcticibacterium sp. TaxID=2173042 RepID=UPI0030F84409
MKNILKIFALGLVVLFAATASNAQKVHVNHFDKVVVNPDIEVVFVHGSEESVNIKRSFIDEDKIQIKVENNSLKLSIEGRNLDKNYKHNGTKAYLVVTYRDLEEVVLKGDQDVLFENKLVARDFEINIYGDSEVTMNEVDIDFMETNIYGDHTLRIKSGNINNHDYTVFGDCDVNTMNVDNDVTKLVIFGDASFDIHVNELLKIKTLGDADVTYSGNPKISKGLSLGDTSIRRAR